MNKRQIKSIKKLRNVVELRAQEKGLLVVKFEVEPLLNEETCIRNNITNRYSVSIELNDENNTKWFRNTWLIFIGVNGGYTAYKTENDKQINGLNKCFSIRTAR